MIRTTHNTARFFVETPHVAAVLLILTAFGGLFGYYSMPQRKDPDIPAREAVALCPWPGSSAEKVAQLVTRRIEERMAENSKIERVTSATRGGLAVVYVRMQEGLPDVAKEFDDIKLKLDAIRDPPSRGGTLGFA